MLNQILIASCTINQKQDPINFFTIIITHMAKSLCIIDTYNIIALDIYLFVNHLVLRGKFVGLDSLRVLSK